MKFSQLFSGAQAKTGKVPALPRHSRMIERDTLGILLGTLGGVLVSLVLLWTADLQMFGLFSICL